MYVGRWEMPTKFQAGIPNEKSTWYIYNNINDRGKSWKALLRIGGDYRDQNSVPSGEQVEIAADIPPFSMIRSGFVKFDPSRLSEAKGKG